MATDSLVITADDLGYSRERSEGIIKCFQSKAITRASLMVNAAAAEHAASLALTCKLPIGLHLNLSEGTPISPASKVSSLISEDGFMHSKMAIRERNKEGHINYEEVQTEIGAQIEKFKELTGTLPLYVDGHQHVHILPGIRDVFAQTLHSRGIHETRLPMEHNVAEWTWIPAASRNFYQSVVDDALASKDVFNKYSVRHSDGFAGMAFMGRNMSVDRMTEMIFDAFRQQKLNDNGTNGTGTVEVMVHPGYPAAPDSGGCGQGPDDFAQSEDRLHELNLLMSEQFLSFCQNFRMSAQVQ